MKKRTLSLVLSILMILTLVPVAAIAANDGYTDVHPDYWAYDVISQWSGNGYGVLRGNPDGTFAPTREITLGELAAILARTFGYIERARVQAFPAWTVEYIQKAVA